MLTGRHAVAIARPVEVVFDHVADGSRNPAWRQAVSQATLLSGDGGAGTVWHQVVRGLTGRPLQVDYRVTVFDRPRRYAYEFVDGPVRGGCEYTFQADSAASTTVSLAVRLSGRGLFAGLTGAQPRQMAAELDALDQLRSALQAPPGDGA